MRDDAQQMPPEYQGAVVDAVRSVVSDLTAISVTDPDGVITFVNDCFCERSGYSRTELVGDTHEKLESGMHHPEFFDEMRETLARGDSWRGSMCNRAKDGREFWEDVTIVPTMGPEGRPESYVSIRIEPGPRHSANEREIYRMAHTDTATGLPNRSALMRAVIELTDRSSFPRLCGFLSVSIDEHATVNDAFGSAVGDELLLVASARLCELAGDGARVGRIDAFTLGVLLPNAGDSAASAALTCAEAAERITAVLTKPVDLGGGVRAEASVSIGFVVYAGHEFSARGVFGTGHADEVLNRAEVARKCALRAGGSYRVRQFTASMLAQAQERVQLGQELRQAVEAEQLRLYAQPIVDADRRVIGAEALVRWLHPVRGLLMPGDFIPLAEQSGRVVDVGAWVLERACMALLAWQKCPNTADLTLSVNLSEHEIRAAGFAEQVRNRVNHYHLPPGRLQVELTESMWHRDVASTAELLKSLRDAGVSASLDDFGTGYSSLSYLRDLPVQQLKIDRSFVSTVASDQRSVAVTRTIVELGRTFGLQVVAEGVETEAQFETLRVIGVDAFQGFLFAPARPIEEPLLVGALPDAQP